MVFRRNSLRGIISASKVTISGERVFPVINLRCMTRRKDIQLPDVPPELYPDVDVLIATRSEDAELLKKKTRILPSCGPYAITSFLLVASL